VRRIVLKRTSGLYQILGALADETPYPEVLSVPETPAGPVVPFASLVTVHRGWAGYHEPFNAPTGRLGVFNPEQR
jgi:hypothetical protein